MKTELEIAQEKEHPYSDVNDRTLDDAWATIKAGGLCMFIFAASVAFMVGLTWIWRAWG